MLRLHLQRRVNPLIRAFENGSTMTRNGSTEVINPLASACVLLFSGGRDSSIAAVRLGREYSSIELVTVSTEHLVGMNRVIGRLCELKRHLQMATRWHHFSFDGEPETGSEILPTCLPCHAVYLLAGLTVAADANIANVAFGYTQYQSSWAEQTAHGRKAISDVIALFGRRAVFPVADLKSKEQAISGWQS